MRYLTRTPQLKLSVPFVLDALMVALNNLRIVIYPLSKNADEPTLNDAPHRDVVTASVFRWLIIGLSERL